MENFNNIKCNSSGAVFPKNQTNTHKCIFKCEICDRTYKLKTLLYAHQQSHKNPFKCVCGKHFTFKSNLTRHTKKCHICLEARRRGEAEEQHQQLTVTDEELEEVAKDVKHLSFEDENYNFNWGDCKTIEQKLKTEIFVKEFYRVRESLVVRLTSQISKTRRFGKNFILIIDQFDYKQLIIKLSIVEDIDGKYAQFLFLDVTTKKQIKEDFVAKSILIARTLNYNITGVVMDVSATNYKSIFNLSGDLQFIYDNQSNLVRDEILKNSRKISRPIFKRKR